MKQRLLFMTFCTAGVALLCAPSATFAQAYGHVSGQFVLDGAVPELAPLTIAGKDAEVCAAKKHPNETLIVDAETKGIANVIVYLKKAPSVIHPDLKKPKEKTLVFDQKNCRFTPHVLLVQAGQTVLVKSDDPINHNTHTHPFRNEELNFILQPNDRKGVPVKYEQPELFPTMVNCDLHPHMKAYWMILDHPYMAVTDAEGKFTIKNLPAGKHEFTVWHEQSGYVDRAMKATVTADKTNDLGKMKVPLAKFKLQ